MCTSIISECAWQDVKLFFVLDSVPVCRLALCALVWEFSSRKLPPRLGVPRSSPASHFLVRRPLPFRVSPSSTPAQTLTKTAHDFLSFPSFVWYTPFLLGCFFIPDETRWASFHWAHWTSSGSHQGQQVFLHGLFFNRHHSSSAFKFVYVTLSDKTLP